jgi:hypothetical protein
VVRAPPDGYTLLLTSANDVYNPSLYPDLKYDYFRDIAPIASIALTPQVMEVNPSVPVKTVLEFITYAKANPGKVNYASAGVGTGAHLCGELFKMMAGVDMVHVPYRGAAPMISDLIAGQVQVSFDFLPSSIEHIRAGAGESGIDLAVEPIDDFVRRALRCSDTKQGNPLEARQKIADRRQVRKRRPAAANFCARHGGTCFNTGRQGTHPPCRFI